MKDVYVYTKCGGTVVRTMKFNNGGTHVAIDFNQERQVVGVEVLDALDVTVNGDMV